jgi:hypothetical protein
MLVNKYSKFNKLPGALLLELLVVIGVCVILIPIVAQIIITSLNVNKVSVESMAAFNLIDEEITATDSIGFSRWQDIYNLTKSTSTHYYAAEVAGAWTVASGDEAVSVNGINYTRYFTVSNVCRDDATNNIIADLNIPPCTIGNSDDPSVQRIIINVDWGNQSVSKNTYLLRWRNQVCNQTNWVGIGATAVTCPSTLYDSSTGIDINTNPGSLQIQHN